MAEFSLNTVDSGKITQLLHHANNGEKKAYDKLFPLIYHELRDIAAIQLASERSDHTLSRTALVHEVYMKWLNQENFDIKNRKHLLCIAASAMHQILIDYARKKLAAKRGNGAHHVEIEESYMQIKEAEEFLLLEEACEELKSFDERLYRIVELRFFMGLSNSQISEIMEVSKSTIDRDWKKAKTWLYIQLNN